MKKFVIKNNLAARSVSPLTTQKIDKTDLGSTKNTIAKVIVKAIFGKVTKYDDDGKVVSLDLIRRCTKFENCRFF